MDLRQAAYFVAVVDHGGITRAAEALYIAQPSLSQAIRKLERELGAQLFDRSGRRLTLTAAGEALNVSARRVISEAKRAREQVAAVSSLETGRLHISALGTLAVDPLPRLASRMRRRHPGIQLRVLDPGGSAGVVKDVRQGRAELGLTDLPVRNSSLISRAMWTQDVALVVPQDMAAQLSDPVPLETVADIPLILETTDRSTQTLIDEAVSDAVGTVAIRCAHRAGIWELVMAGAGATFLPRQLAERELTGVAVLATTPRIRRSVGLVFRAGPLTPAARAFVHLAGVTP